MVKFHFKSSTKTFELHTKLLVTSSDGLQPDSDGLHRDNCPVGHFAEAFALLTACLSDEVRLERRVGGHTLWKTLQP